MAIEIRQEQQGAVKILELVGRLDTETSADLEIVVQDLLAAGERHFLIDLAGISYVSSAGLRVLLALAKQLDGGKGSLRLCGLTPPVAQVFDVAGFSKLFAIFRERKAALGNHPQAKPDAQLARSAAELMGAGTGSSGEASAVSNNKAAAELARSAAKILGAEPAAVSAVGQSPKASPPVTPLPARVKLPAAKPQVAPEGFMTRLRNLFRGKR